MFLAILETLVTFKKQRMRAHLAAQFTRLALVCEGGRSVTIDCPDPKSEDSLGFWDVRPRKFAENPSQ